MKHGLRFWRYILNASYFLDYLFSDIFLAKLYRMRPELNCVSASDFLMLSMLPAQHKWDRSPALNFGGPIGLAPALIQIILIK